MRTIPMLSTLFAVSLLGGVALAEGPHMGAAAPRVMEKLRAHGDIVDKAYSATRGGGAAAGAAMPAGQAGVQKTATPMQRVSSRINCSDSGVDCGAPKASAASSSRGGGDAVSHGGSSIKRPPAILDKILGNDRTNFNEAGEDQGMSLRAAKRAWERANGFKHHGAGAGTELPLSAKEHVDRHSEQRSEARMSCNEADECSMSLKASRKEWANASIRAGTWKGPAKEPVSNAALRIREQRAAEGAGAAKPAEAKEAAAAAHPEAAGHSDHQH
jgi:hypothetical protein